MLVVHHSVFLLRDWQPDKLHWKVKQYYFGNSAHLLCVRYSCFPVCLT